MTRFPARPRAPPVTFCDRPFVRPRPLAPTRIGHTHTGRTNGRTTARATQSNREGRWCPTANNPNQPEPQEVNAYKDYSEKPIVIIQAHEFRLSEVLKHIEAGRIVRVILPEQRPASD